jgi:hypothetical protein
MKQVYVFAGASGSGRKEVMADLISWSRQGGNAGKIAVILPKGETRSETDFVDAAGVLEWSGADAEFAMPEFPPDADTIFLLLDGSADPIGQFEVLAVWFGAHVDVELARIITVVNSKLLFEQPALKPWFEACIHFSDVVLLANRAGVPNKWFGDFRQHYEKECYPCQFELVKDGKVHNPAEVLCPEARRMSLAFDFLEEANAAKALAEAKEEYEIVDETENEDEGVVVDEDDEDEAPAVEPYFDRDAAGRRKTRLPDIRNFLK